MDKNIEVASYHEAGHAIMAYVVGWNIRSIKLFVNDNILQSGVTNYEFTQDNQEDHINLNRRIHALMGGPISESFYRGEKKINLDLLGVDGVTIDELLNNHSDKSNIIQTAINQTATFLNLVMCRAATKEIVNILINKHSISKEEFNEIMIKHQVPQMNF